VAEPLAASGQGRSETGDKETRRAPGRSMPVCRRVGRALTDTKNAPSETEMSMAKPMTLGLGRFRPGFAVPSDCTRKNQNRLRRGLRFYREAVPQQSPGSRSAPWENRTARKLTLKGVAQIATNSVMRRGLSHILTV
jgi:hypothetical protein